MRVWRSTGLLGLLALLVGFSGCATAVETLRHDEHFKGTQITPEDFVQRYAGDDVQVVLSDGREKSLTVLRSSDSSVVFREMLDTLKLDTRDVRGIIIPHPVLGAVVGCVVGTFAGAVGGIGVAHALSDDPWAGLGGFLYGSTIGSVAGLVLGIFYPPESVYQLTAPGKAAKSDHAP